MPSAPGAPAAARAPGSPDVPVAPPASPAPEKPADAKVPDAAKGRLASLRTFPLGSWVALIGFGVVALALVWFAIFGTIPGIGSGPPLISLVVWSVFGYRLLRHFR